MGGKKEYNFAPKLQNQLAQCSHQQHQYYANNKDDADTTTEIIDITVNNTITKSANLSAVVVASAASVSTSNNSICESVSVIHHQKPDTNVKLPPSTADKFAD